jgi:integrase/recombinase XerC
MNRRIAAVRGLFEFAVMTGARAENPVPAARRSTGLRPARRGLLGHVGPGRPRSGGRLVRQPQRLPEALEPEDVAAFAFRGTSVRNFRRMTLVGGGEPLPAAPGLGWGLWAPGRTSRPSRCTLMAWRAW